MTKAMDSRLVFCSLIWGFLCLGVFSLEAPMNMRLPRSPQMPPTVAARQPSKSISTIGRADPSIHIEQKSSHRHPYLTRYEYNDDQSNRIEENKESPKRSAMPSSPFIASRMSINESKDKKPKLNIRKNNEIMPPENLFPNFENDKESSSPERSIDHYLDIDDQYSYSEKDRYPAGSYSKVLNKMDITDKEARTILKQRGVNFKEFINFIAGGASLEQVKQILRVPERINVTTLNKTGKLKIQLSHSSQNILPAAKIKENSISSKESFDANALPSKDSPIIAHFRKPPIKNKDIGSAAILSLSVKEKENIETKSDAKVHNHPHKTHNSIKNDADYQSDQATLSSPEFRFEDGLRLFLIICGGIGGIILLLTIILVMYNILTCKESRMAQRNYELGQQIRKVEDSLEIC